MGMKVIDAIWFSSVHGHCGLVLGENDRGERKIYGGPARGLDQGTDERQILAWGNRANIGMLESFLVKARGDSPGKREEAIKDVGHWIEDLAQDTDCAMDNYEGRAWTIYPAEVAALKRGELPKPEDCEK